MGEFARFVLENTTTPTSSFGFSIQTKDLNFFIDV